MREEKIVFIERQRISERKCASRSRSRLILILIEASCKERGTPSYKRLHRGVTREGIMLYRFISVHPPICSS